MKPWLFVLVAACLVLSACSSVGKQTLEKTAPQLLREGQVAYDEGDFKKALENFEQLRNWYGFETPYVIVAQLRIAQANYHLKQYPEAIAAYEDFERLHPRNEAIPEVIFYIGQSYFEQIDSVDRDQSTAQKAYDTFQRLVNQYPQSPYSRTALAQMVLCYQSLAKHDFYVGEFYLKSKHYAAALHRFLSIVEKYPDVGLHRDALLFAAECQAYLPKSAEPSE